MRSVVGKFLPHSQDSVSTPLSVICPVRDPVSLPVTTYSKFGFRERDLDKGSKVCRLLSYSPSLTVHIVTFVGGAWVRVHQGSTIWPYYKFTGSYHDPSTRLPPPRGVTVSLEVGTLPFVGEDRRTGEGRLLRKTTKHRSLETSRVSLSTSFGEWWRLTDWHGERQWVRSSKRPDTSHPGEGQIEDTCHFFGESRDPEELGKECLGRTKEVKDSTYGSCTLLEIICREGSERHPSPTGIVQPSTFNEKTSGREIYVPDIQVRVDFNSLNQPA